MNSDRRGFFKKLLGLGAAVIGAKVALPAVAVEAAPKVITTIGMSQVGVTMANFYTVTSTASVWYQDDCGGYWVNRRIDFPANGSGSDFQGNTK